MQKRHVVIAGLSAFLLSGCGEISQSGLGNIPQKEKTAYTEEMNRAAANGQGGGVQGEQQDSQLVTKGIRDNGMNNKYTEAPKMSIDVKKSYTAVMKTTAGDITIVLHAKEVPITVNNFVFLAKEKFYDGVIFHRTIPGFMIQGGDPTGTGMGGPGYKFADEPFTGEYKRGVLAMANAGPNTNGSQFFIMHKDYPLPKSYVIFGEVTAGIDVVDAIASAPTVPGGEGSQPAHPVTIESLTVSEK
ncbi:MAG: peptidylprolyl isomerase [Candidatus Moraniibacteriota bacterium]